MIRALAIAALAATTSEAAVPLNPPERFAGPYEGQLILVVVDRSNVRKECENAGLFAVKANTAGCAFLHDGFCLVYVAARSPRAPVEAIIRHEIAHCNGWSAEHEQ